MYKKYRTIFKQAFSLLLLSILLTMTWLKSFPTYAQIITTTQPQKVMEELPSPNTEDTLPYEIVEQLNLEDGTEISAHHIISPSVPPIDIQADRAASIIPTTGATTLPDFPSFSWVFGCGAVSGAMIAAYQDRNGYPNLYTGPTNDGLMPITDTSWPTWSDGNRIYPSNPLIASKNGLDGRTSRGSIENYWVESGSTANDPYITNGWTEHAWGDAIGDYMKTSQSAYGNNDGDSTIYNFNTSSDRLKCDVIEENEYFSDLTLGRKQFYEAKGYTVNTCYNQKTDNKVTDGFSLADFQAEIDAGWPVFLHLRGHFIVGYGYSGSTIFIRDTWDSDPNQTYSMPWGGEYLGMDLISVSIVHLDPPTTPTFLPLIISRTGNGAGTVTSDPIGIDCGDTCQATFAEDTEVRLEVTPKPGSFFSGWSGACSGTAPTCRVTMTQSVEVTANFTSTTEPTFLDVPTDYWAYSWIENLFRAEITSGCTKNPLQYCPQNYVTRAEMAKFLLKGFHGGEYNAPMAGESTGFADVSTNHWAASWIKQLSMDGITSGCGEGNYCPENNVSRAEMAKFLLTAIHGPGYSPPKAVSNTGFYDVPLDYWAANWITQLASEGITSGCGDGNYCPDYFVTRAEMAKFLVISFNLPEIEPPNEPEGVTILSNHTAFVDNIDYLNIVGEVNNNTDDNLRFVEINVNIFDRNGYLLDTDFTFTLLENLPAGEKTCFHLSVQEPEGWDYYEFEPVSYWTDGNSLPNLSVINLSSSYDSYFGWYEILGQVTNNLGSTVNWVSPVGTLYNASDQVIGCDFTYVNSTDLLPGQTSSFEMLFLGRDYNDVASYRIQVDGEFE